jgi:MANEC domain
VTVLQQLCRLIYDNANMCVVPLLLAYFAVVQPEVSAVPEPFVNEQQLHSIIHESAASQRLWRSTAGKSERAAEPSQVDDCVLAKERSETIIKTKESQAAGAVFIASPVVTSRSECAAECCNSKNCNTAVVKEKVCLVLIYLVMLMHLISRLSR